MQLRVSQGWLESIALIGFKMSEHFEYNEQKLELISNQLKHDIKNNESEMNYLVLSSATLDIAKDIADNLDTLKVLLEKYSAMKTGDISEDSFLEHCGLKTKSSDLDIEDPLVNKILSEI